MQNKPNYYAILTAEVRYDNSLSDKAKLIYAELTALSNQHGYAYPSNDFLAKLYDVTPLTISRIIRELESKNYVKIDIKKTKKGTVRKIFISEKTTQNPLIKNDKCAPIKNDKTHSSKMISAISINNTRDNTTRINTRESINKLDSVPQNVSEKITLSLVKNRVDFLGLKKINPEVFFNYYSLRDFKINHNLSITVKNLDNSLKLWDLREFENKTNNKSEIDRPEWLDEYLEEISEMEG